MQAARPITCIWGPDLNASLGLTNNRCKKFARRIIPISTALPQKEKLQGQGTESEYADGSVETRTNLIANLDGAQTESKKLEFKDLFAAVAPTLAITTLAAGAAYAVYLRFLWQLQENSEVPWIEIFGTFSLALGAAVATELWAGWVHENLWHGSFWDIHVSHHRPRKGLFELNDVFYIMNATPAIILMTFGVLHRGPIPGLCFAMGLGITMCGITYMFVHDGVLHGRFPVGPIANVPFFQKVRVAHQVHHANLLDGVPYGILFGPKELEDAHGFEKLEELLERAKTKD